MNDFDGLLASDYGFKPQGKSAPMSASKGSGTLNFGIQSHGGSGGGGSRSSRNNSPLGESSADDYDSIFGSSTNNRKTQDAGSLDGFGDVFGAPPKYSSASESRGGDSVFNFDSMFGDSVSKSSSMPKYDKPVYDDDIFEGLPGLKNTSFVKYDDVFSSVTSPPKRSGAFDDLLGSLSGPGSESKSSRVKGSDRVEKGVENFDDLLPGFGGGSPPSERPTSEASRPRKPTVDATRPTSTTMDDPFVILESASPPEVSSSGLFTDPLEEVGKMSKSESIKVDVSSVKGGLYDDIDPLDSLGKSMPTFSSEVIGGGKDRSSSRKVPRSSDRQTPDSKEPTDKSFVRSPESHSEKNTPTVSNSSHESFGRIGSPPPSYAHPTHNVNSHVDTSPTSEENLESSDDVWLTVSEIPLFTQPTSAPPPSRPPPPRPAKVSKAEMGSFAYTNARRKDFSSFPNSTQDFQASKPVPAAARSSVVSPIDELEDFAMGRTQNNIDEHSDVFSAQEVERKSDAAASAAAMKEAMDRAEAKFRHAKEVKERENAKAARSREAVHLEKDEKPMQDAQERAFREKQERPEREWQQREREEELREQRRLEEERERAREFEREREEKEREQRRLEKERERARAIEREREKARQAVERATREARERAGADARQRAEKLAVEKANAEARGRAERVAVQRAHAEARERAAADAKERAEKAAAEARERTNIEARERTVRAEADARLRAERAAVERAAGEARQRAAAAAAATKVNNQKSEDDLESFFGMGRPSSAPKARSNSSDPFETQFQTRQGPEVARRTSVGTSSSIRKASSATNIVDDLSSIFGAAPSSGSSGGFAEMEGESEERRRARLERHQRTQERAAKALAEKNQRDLQVQRDQAERYRIAETLDVEIKRWAAGKEGNLRALLSTMQYVLWPECGWQPVSLTDLITGASVKKVYRKATLCIHPDKVQQKGANLQQKYIAEKVFDLLKEAWNKFNSEELF